VREFDATGMLHRFEMRQSRDEDGALRLTLVGDLDLAVADRVRARLASLRRSGAAVRLDLSQLSFIDSSGLRVVIMARANSRRSGWKFEIGREVSPSVGRPLELLGLSSYLWSA
jgi:anti-anti-sigma factor